MKKILLVLSILLLSPTLVHSATITPTTFNMNGDYLVSYTITPTSFVLSCTSPDNYLVYKNPTDVLYNGFTVACNALETSYDSEMAFNWALDDYPYYGTSNHLLELTSEQNTYCSPTEITYSDCISNGVVDDISFTTTNITLSDINTLGEIINVSNLAFAGAMGFEFSEATDWVGVMLKLLIGGGLATLSYLMPWILAIIIVMTILAFIYRGFRFFRH